MDTFDWKKLLAGSGVVLVLGLIGVYARPQSRVDQSATKTKPKYAAQKDVGSDSREEEAFNYSEPFKTIKVDISGHVAKPGVYEITEGSRLEDLVKLAGGLKSTADRDAVNLAVKLQDEQKIVILGSGETIDLDDVKTLNGSITPMAVADDAPITASRKRKTTSSTKPRSSEMTAKEKEVADQAAEEKRRQELIDAYRRKLLEGNRGSSDNNSESESYVSWRIRQIQGRDKEANKNQSKTFSNPYSHSTTKTTRASSKARPTGRISINRASDQELESLPGIGPSLALRIIDYRKSKGGFRSIEDLQNVRGIGPNVFRKLSPWLTL